MYIQVSWCHMSRGNGKGSRWKLTRTAPFATKKNGHNRKRKKSKNQKKQKGTLIEVLAVDGSPVCTWVPKANLHIDIAYALKDSITSGGRLSGLKQNSRVFRVPKKAHPLTMWVKPSSANAVTNFFTPSTPSALNKRLSVRI